MSTDFNYINHSNDNDMKKLLLVLLGSVVISASAQAQPGGNDMKGQKEDMPQTMMMMDPQGPMPMMDMMQGMMNMMKMQQKILKGVKPGEKKMMMMEMDKAMMRMDKMMADMKEMKMPCMMMNQSAMPNCAPPPAGKGTPLQSPSKN
jgi:hypothetical protein